VECALSWSVSADSLLYVVLFSSSVQFASFSGHAMRGLWASLAIELYYFTSDDDERYAIQAHTQLLRNMVVQSAAPPLGYPVLVTAPTTALPPV